MKITNTKQLEDFSKTTESYNKYDEMIFEGLKIDEKQSDELTNIFFKYDPPDIQFINCQINDNSFDSIFNRVVNLSVLDCNLTNDLAKSLIVWASGETLKTLNLSNNCIGKDGNDFINYFKQMLGYFPSLDTLIISNNCISNEDAKDFEIYAQKQYYDFTVIN